jgi:hypothetical protein
MGCTKYLQINLYNFSSRTTSLMWNMYEYLHCNVNISFQHLRGVKQIPIFIRFNVRSCNSLSYFVLLRGFFDRISAEG